MTSELSQHLETDDSALEYTVTSRSKQLLSQQAIDVFANWVDSAESDGARQERVLKIGSTVASVKELFDQSLLQQELATHAGQLSFLDISDTPDRSDADVADGVIAYDFLAEAEYVHIDDSKEWQVNARALFNHLAENEILKPIQATSLEQHILDGAERKRNTTYAIDTLRKKFHASDALDSAVRRMLGVALHEHHNTHTNIVDDLYSRLKIRNPFAVDESPIETFEQAQCIAVGLIRQLYVSEIGLPAPPEPSVSLAGKTELKAPEPSSAERHAEELGVAEENTSEVATVVSSRTIDTSKNIPQKVRTPHNALNLEATSIYKMQSIRTEKLAADLSSLFVDAVDRSVLSKHDTRALFPWVMGQDKEMTESIVDAIDKIDAIYQVSGLRNEAKASTVLSLDAFEGFLNKEQLQDIRVRLNKSLRHRTLTLTDSRVQMMIAGVLGEIV